MSQRAQHILAEFYQRQRSRLPLLAALTRRFLSRCSHLSGNAGACASQYAQLVGPFAAVAATRCSLPPSQ